MLALLIVGSVVSALTGYAVSFITYTPWIPQLQSDLSRTKSALSASQSQVESLQNQLAETAAQLSIAEANLTEAQTNITLLEDQLAEANQTIAEYKYYMDLMGSRYSEVVSQTVHTAILGKLGYRRFTAHGFSFEYPEHMTISTQNATCDSGIVTAETVEPHEAISVEWSKTEDYLTLLKATLEAFFTEMAQSEDVASMERGELTDKYMISKPFPQIIFPHIFHRVIYQDYTAVIKGETLYGIYGAWYCGDTKRLYRLHIISSEEVISPQYEAYLDSFICHVPIWEEDNQ